MQPDLGTYCPLVKKDCLKTKCAWFTQISGSNPNTGQPVNEWGCAVAWLPMLLIENAQMSRQTGAAVESFRNEMVEANKAALTMQAAEQQKMIDGGS